MRNIIFQLHWIVGIILGAFLAFSGLTGGLMALGPEMTRCLSGGCQTIPSGGGAALPVQQLYERLAAANPDRHIVDVVTYAGAGQPARVRFSVPTFTGPTAPIPESRMVNPYTGELLPDHPLGRRVEHWMHWLHEVHKGHWGGPAAVAAQVGGMGIAYATLLVLFLVPSGLYMRWPRGAAKWRWRSWLYVNPRLKGRPFLWNLHAVIGTCVVLTLLISAHTGTFGTRRIAWYSNGLRSALGLQLLEEHGPPPGGAGGPGGLGGPGGAPGPRGAMPPPGPGSGMNTGVKLVSLAADGYINANGDFVNATVVIMDPRTRVLMPQPQPQPQVHRSGGFGAWLESNNQNLHEGRYWGTVGIIIMALSSLMMPVFFVTGWMMYLKRRRRRQLSTT